MIVALANRPLTACQLTYTAILVALSRVPMADSIRLLDSGSGTLARSLEYIEKLRPSSFVDAFFAGFANDREEWDPNRSIAFVKNNVYRFKK